MSMVTTIKDKIKKVFEKKKPVKSEKVKPVPAVESEDGFVWIKLTPNHPHTGISIMSDELEPHFKPALKVMGISLGKAKLELCGKLIDWALVPILSSGESIAVDINIFRRWLK